MSLYKFVGRKNQFYELFGDSIIKLNYNCPEKYKDGEGQGSCKGYKPGSEQLGKTINKPKAIDSSKSTSVATTIKDYKAASPEQKAEFLRSEISKGKQSTQLPDGTSINNIRGKLKSIEKKISSNPVTTSNINIKQVKSVIVKVKKEQASGKVSKNTINELKNAIEIAKSKPELSNTTTNSLDSLPVLSKEVVVSKENLRYTYPPTVIDSSKQYDKISKISVGLNNPGYYGKNGAVWYDLTPIKMEDVKPYVEFTNKILNDSNLPPLTGGLIFNTDKYPAGNAEYNIDKKHIQVNRGLLDKKVYADRTSSQEQYKKENNGDIYTISSIAKDQQENIQMTIMHEIGHHELVTYMERTGNAKIMLDVPKEKMIYGDNGKQQKVKVTEEPIYCGDKEWKDVVMFAAKSGWKAPSKYSESNLGELFAECSSLYTYGSKELIHPEILKYIEKVKTFNKQYRGKK